jgi:hypothetical protein
MAHRYQLAWRARNPAGVLQSHVLRARTAPGHISFVWVRDLPLDLEGAGPWISAGGSKDRIDFICDWLSN